MIMRNITKMKYGLLDTNHKIYKILPTTPWWDSLKNDPDIYIEARKGNILDAYYYGARIAEIKYNSKTEYGEISSETTAQRIYIFPYKTSTTNEDTPSF